MGIAHLIGFDEVTKISQSHVFFIRNCQSQDLRTIQKDQSVRQGALSHLLVPPCYLRLLEAVT